MNTNCFFRCNDFSESEYISIWLQTSLVVQFRNPSITFNYFGATYVYIFFYIASSFILVYNYVPIIAFFAASSALASSSSSYGCSCFSLNLWTLNSCSLIGTCRTISLVLVLLLCTPIFWRLLLKRTLKLIFNYNKIKIQGQIFIENQTLFPIHYKILHLVVQLGNNFLHSLYYFYF